MFLLRVSRNVYVGNGEDCATGIWFFQVVMSNMLHSVNKVNKGEENNCSRKTEK